MTKAMFVLANHALEVVYDSELRDRIGGLVDVCAPPRTPADVAEDPAVLQEVRILLSGWGAPRLDTEFLQLAPNLDIVFYGAGSVRGLMTDAAWDRGIRVTSAYAANAVPVAEYALSQILFCLKKGWYYVRTTVANGSPAPRIPTPGAFRTTVGVVSLGMVGRRVCQLLGHFDLEVLAFDPYADSGAAGELGVELVSLEELFRRSNVVSLHTPWLPETEGMITGALFESMPRDAAFINTARGAVVREPEMIRVLAERHDLTAVLDVTHPEPPPPDSPLYRMGNVVLTPHIAGSMDRECRRMGWYMLDELQRYLRGEPLQWEIDRERAAVLA